MSKATDIFANPYYQQLATTTAQGGLQFATALEQATPRFNVNAPQQMSVGGRPQYTLGSIVTQASNFNRKDYGRGLVGQGAATGLQIGANPLLMGATGGLSAPIGAAVGAIGGLIGQGAKRNKAEQMQQERMANIQAAQTQFNTQQKDYTQGYLARRQYEDQF